MLGHTSIIDGNVYKMVTGHICNIIRKKLLWNGKSCGRVEILVGRRYNSSRRFNKTYIGVLTVLVGLGLLGVGDTLNAWLSDHNIEHDFTVSTSQDELVPLLKSESLIDSDIFAGAALNKAGFIQRISLHTDR